MLQYSTLIDNSNERLSMVSAVRDLLCDAHCNTLKIATGYWDIPGMSLLMLQLKEFLQRENAKLQILIGTDPVVRSYQQKNPKYKNAHTQKDFMQCDLQNLEVKDEFVETVRLLKEYCLSDFGNSRIQIKMCKTNADGVEQFFHAKCYIFLGNDYAKGIVGSSNFTQKGLEDNSELNYLEWNNQNVAASPTENSYAKGHNYWFDEKWNQADEWNKIFLEEVLNGTKIEKEADKPVVVDMPLTPYELYIKVLSYKLGACFDDDTSSQIKSYLPEGYSVFEYQIDAVAQCLRIMEKHGGFMLADVVGLGKTVVGTLVIKHFISHPGVREAKVLVVSPPAILKGWQDTIDSFDKEKEDKIASHIDFVSTGKIMNFDGDSDDFDEDIDCGDFGEDLKLRNYGLIIIDECHKFRNSDTQMYYALDDLISQIRGLTGHTPYMGLLSATPQNNEPKDLKNQIFLFQRDHKNCTLDKIPGKNLDGYFSYISKKFHSLRKETMEIASLHTRTEEDKNKLSKIDEEFSEISKDIREKILVDILVRRTRTDIKNSYAKDMEAQGLIFPEVNGPNNLEYKMDAVLSYLFANTMDLIKPEEDFDFDDSNALCYYRYRATQFLKEKETRDKYRGRGALSVDVLAKQLARIMQILLVKRLESSFDAFTESLRNLKKNTYNMIWMWENNTIFICPQLNINDEFDIEKKEKHRKKSVSYEDCVEDIRKKIKKLPKDKRNAKNQNAEYTREDFDSEYIKLLKRDYDLICDLCDRWEANDKDPKLDKFKESLLPILFDKKKNKPQKLVIFSEAIGTVETLKKACEELGFKDKVLTVTSENRDKVQPTIQENFDANYKGKQKNQYQIIITTEVLAEGVNLHRANCILNYDTPWNSTRMMQRIGRVNRIGSKEPVVYVYNFLPSAEGNQEIQLVEKAHIKLQSFHTLFGEDSKIFTDDEIFDSYGRNDVESENQEYIRELKKYKKDYPERYDFIVKTETDLQMATDAPNGMSYFVVRSPKIDGLFVEVDESGKSKIIPDIEMYQKFRPAPEMARGTLPDNWSELCKTATRKVVQHLYKIRQSRGDSTEATRAKGYIEEMSKGDKLDAKSQNLLNLAFSMISKGNEDITRIVNAIGKEVFNDTKSFVPLTQNEINNLIIKKLDNIVAQQAKQTGDPEVYIGLAK